MPESMEVIDVDQVQGRESDYGRLVTDLAIGHRARVVELGSAAAITPWCSDAGIGLGPGEIDALIAGGTAEPTSG